MMAMPSQAKEILTDEELEILQEIMNIAFGQSAADLAEVIDTHVILSVPYIRCMQVAELPDYFKTYVKEYNRISIVEQKFWGMFAGDALLVFSSGAGKELIAMLQQDKQPVFESDPVEILERETLMEVGNILIGACVGRIAELLEDIVTYTPPMAVVEKDYTDAIVESHYDPDSTAIVLKTDFKFEEKDVSGFLFLVTSQGSVAWLKDALKKFIEQYEC
jgi:chemotaxis protein CheC